MTETGRAATRYEAAKLYLIGKYAGQLVAVARTVTDALSMEDGAPAGLEAASQAMYGAESGCVTRLHLMTQLAAGVLPWEVVQGLHVVYADLAEHVGSPSGEAVLTDATRVIACVEWLEGQIIPIWDVRARS